MFISSFSLGFDKILNRSLLGKKGLFLAHFELQPIKVPQPWPQGHKESGRIVTTVRKQRWGGLGLSVFPPFYSV